MFTKKENERKHAKFRIAARFGIVLNHNGYKEIIKMIQAGQTKKVGQTSDNRPWHQITYQDKTFIVVYDRKRKEIVTALPLDYLERCKEECNE